VRSGLLAIDRLLVSYLGLTGLLALVAGGGTGAAIAAVHAIVIAAIVYLGRKPAPQGWFLAFLRVAYPVILTPLLYAELATLNQLVTGGYLDEVTQRWELALFGLQPSIVASRWLPYFGLSELLYLGYVSYYLVVPAALVGVAVTRGPEAVHRVALTIMLAFFACYAIFILFPVAGPRYFFPKIEGELAQGRLFSLVHAILEGGSSKGTAFPSSHIAASVAAVLGAGREDRRWLWLLGPAVVLLTLGTVYGRFHYAVDAIAGVLIALIAWAATGRRRRAGEATPAFGRVSNG